ncbi:hypothetical protein QR680_010861 [Steinernema hermaphroditum]|uniref:G-protein coupled receptors family 1 profile domain-containing protein n=1 Tax=Steinernema hermaphroditum TaxID=289476 RepID=A0AA39IQD7_9BILA|nr:hypothetical protein QR680_010861 [Steinernema hermaphroditum]
MNVDDKTYYISLANTLFSIVTIALNGAVIMHMSCKQKGKRSRHMSMITIKIVFDVVFATSVVVHMLCVMGKIGGKNTSEDWIFYSGNLEQSLIASLGTLNIFIAMDRLFAMRAVINYSIHFAQKIETMAVVVVSSTFILYFTIYMLTRKNSPEHQFIHLVDNSVLVLIQGMTILALLVGLMITALFLIILSHFTIEREVNVVTVFSTAVKKANKIVIYSMLLEFVFLVIPSGLGILLQYLSDSYVIDIMAPMTCFYTTLCAIVHYAILVRRKETSAVSSVQKTMS